MTRAILLSLAVLLASCTPEPAQSCPGERVASVTFNDNDSTKVEAGMLDAGLDPDPTLTDCAAAMGFPPSLKPFAGTLSADATGPGAALCRTTGPILFGMRSGAHWEVEDAADGAVLGGCDPTCAARSRLVIRGDLMPDATAPTSFSGAFVEQLTQTDGSCGPCVLPCAARYALQGEASP